MLDWRCAGNGRRRGQNWAQKVGNGSHEIFALAPPIRGMQ